MTKTDMVLAYALTTKHLPGRHNQLHHGRPGERDLDTEAQAGTASDSEFSPASGLPDFLVGNQRDVHSYLNDPSVSDEQERAVWDRYQWLLTVLGIGGHGVPTEDIPTINDLMRVWSLTSAKLPNHVSVEDAALMSFGNEVGVNDIGAHTITIIPANIDKLLGLTKNDPDYAKKHNAAVDAITVHEYGHHVFPGDSIDHKSLMATISNALDEGNKEDYGNEKMISWLSNMYADLVVNYISFKRTKLTAMRDVLAMATNRGIEERAIRAKAEGKAVPDKVDPLWGAYMRAHEVMWKLPSGTLIPEDQLTAEADVAGSLMCAAVRSTVQSDPLRGAALFGRIVNDLLEDMITDKSRELHKNKKPKPQPGGGGEGKPSDGGGQGKEQAPGAPGGQGKPEPGNQEQSNQPADDEGVDGVPEKGRQGAGKPLPKQRVRAKPMSEYSDEEKKQLAEEQAATDKAEQADMAKRAADKEKADADKDRLEEEAKELASALSKDVWAEIAKAMSTMDPAGEKHRLEDRQIIETYGGRGRKDSTVFRTPELADPKSRDERDYARLPDAGSKGRIVTASEAEVVDLDPSLHSQTARERSAAELQRGEASGGGDNFTPTAYQKLLRDLGYVVTENAATMKFYEELARSFGLPPFPTSHASGGDLVYAGHTEWSADSDEFEDLDMLNSILNGGGRVLPGLTTRKKVKEEEEGSDDVEHQKPMDIIVYADSSGSMPNPRLQLCNITLAGVILCLSALKAGAKVKFVKWSDSRTGHVSSEGMTSDKRKVLAVATSYLGGSTHLPGDAVKADKAEAVKAKKNKNTMVIFLSDSDIDHPYQLGQIEDILDGPDGFGGAVVFLNSPKKDPTVMGDYLRDKGWKFYSVGSRAELVPAVRDFAKSTYGGTVRRKPKKAEKPAEDA